MRTSSRGSPRGTLSDQGGPTEFIHDLPVIEAIVRRHLPACFRLEGLDLTTTEPAAGNPALFRVTARIRRVDATPEPAGWGHELGQEVRAGWDGAEFELGIRELPSDYDGQV